MVHPLSRLALLAPALAAAHAGAAWSLWPMPMSVTSLDGACLQVSASTFAFKSSSRSVVLQEALLRFKALAFQANSPAQPCVGKGAHLLDLSISLQSEDETLGPSTAENYTLEVKAPSATLVAANVYAALRGLETFAQLTFGEEGGTWRLPAVAISDAPRFGFRAIMVDTARMFRPVGLLKTMMDAMASAKLNALYLHITDDRCWPLEILSYPLLTQNCSKGCAFNGTNYLFYSQDDIRELVDYAKKRGIRVIPEIDSPGHFDLKGCYPELLTRANYPCPGAGPGKPGTSFLSGPDPSNPETWTFFTKLYRELAGLFPDAYVSLGGDEAWLGPWGCSPAVQQWMKREHLANVGEAARWYEQRLFSTVSANSRSTMMWAPGEGTVSNSTIHLVWSGYPRNGPRDGWKPDFAKFTGQGQQVVLSGPFYLTPGHPQWTHWQDWYHTDPGNFTGGDEDLVLGGMGTIWSDLVKEQILTQAWPLMNAVAEQLWSAQELTQVAGAPTARYRDQCMRLQQRGVLNATGCDFLQVTQVAESSVVVV